MAAVDVIRENGTGATPPGDVGASTAPTWDEIVKLPEIQALPPDQLEAARHQYFLDVVAPVVQPQHLDGALLAFNTDTLPEGGAGGWKNVEPEKPSGWLAPTVNDSAGPFEKNQRFADPVRGYDGLFKNIEMGIQGGRRQMPQTVNDSYPVYVR